MSDESAVSPEMPQNPPADSAPRVRRISNPRPKKTANRAAANAAPPEEGVAVSPEPSAPVESVSAEAAPVSEPAISAGGDWPEPEAPSTGGVLPSEGSKKKRRRKKGKGGGSQNGAISTGHPETPAPPVGEALAAPAQPKPVAQMPQHSQPRPKLDPELLAQRAWKIYLAEISEEGVALVGDNDAKELSRRCFRLAEIFLEEQARRR